jgi:hypothetical protein
MKRHCGVAGQLTACVVCCGSEMVTRSCCHHLLLPATSFAGWACFKLNTRCHWRQQGAHLDTLLDDSENCRCCCCCCCSCLAVLPLVTERLGHPRESVRKKAVMALHHFYQMDPDRSGQLAGAAGPALNSSCQSRPVGAIGRCGGACSE